MKSLSPCTGQSDGTELIGYDESRLAEQVREVVAEFRRLRDLVEERATKGNATAEVELAQEARQLRGMLAAVLQKGYLNSNDFCFYCGADNLQRSQQHEEDCAYVRAAGLLKRLQERSAVGPGGQAELARGEAGKAGTESEQGGKRQKGKR